MKLSGTNLGKLVLRLGVGSFFLLLGLQMFDNPNIFNTQNLQNIGIENISWWLANIFVLLGAFSVFGIFSSYSVFTLLLLFLTQFNLTNLDPKDVLILSSIAGLIFLGAGKYSLDYLFRKKSVTQNLEEKYFEQKKSKPLEISKPHIEHKKLKVQVVTKTKNSDDEEGKTIIEI